MKKNELAPTSLRQVLTERKAWELLRLVYHDQPSKSDIKRWVLNLCAESVSAEKSFYQSAADMASFVLNDDITAESARYHLNRLPDVEK